MNGKGSTNLYLGWGILVAMVIVNFFGPPLLEIQIGDNVKVNLTSGVTFIQLIQLARNPNQPG